MPPRRPFEISHLRPRRALWHPGRTSERIRRLSDRIQWIRAMNRDIVGRSSNRQVGDMFGIGFQEMLIILVVVLIFFGPKRLPDLAKSLGKGIAEFKKASDEIRKGIDEAVKEGESAVQAGEG